MRSGTKTIPLLRSHSSISCLSEPEKLISYPASHKGAKPWLSIPFSIWWTCRIRGRREGDFDTFPTHQYGGCQAYTPAKFRCSFGICRSAGSGIVEDRGCDGSKIVTRALTRQVVGPHETDDGPSLRDKKDQAVFGERRTAVLTPRHPVTGWPPGVVSCVVVRFPVRPSVGRVASPEAASSKWSPRTGNRTACRPTTCARRK